MSTEPIPVSLLRAIGQLPADAKLAYACQPFEEVSFVELEAPQHRRAHRPPGRADVLRGRRPRHRCSAHNRPRRSRTQAFPSAPQAALYPDSTARPSSAAVAAFLKAHGIDYIYADAAHPNSLVVDAVPVATSGGFELLRVP